MRNKDIEPLIYSMGLNVFLISYFQLSLIHELHFFFNMVLEVCIIVFLFQLGAIRALSSSEITLTEYFFKDGGELILFTIFCLWLCSIAHIFSN